MTNAKRFQVAKELGMKLVGSVAGVPLFNGTDEQFAAFHERLGTFKPTI